MPDAEEWRWVVGYEGYYEVSNRGRVRSKARIAINIAGRRYGKRARLLKPSTVAGTDFHSMLPLKKPGQPKEFFGVSRLVYEAFVGPADKKLYIDHIDRNPQNNRPENLRPATPSQNSANTKLARNNTTGFKGVRVASGWCGKTPKRTKWVAFITVNKRQIHLGMHASPEDAARAYNEAARRHFGEFAYQNPV